MEKVKLGLIGCGWAVNDLYAPAFQFLEKGELVAVMDIKEERAKSVQERFKVPRCYTRLDDIVNDKDVEAVIVLTPPHHHCEPIVAAAKAGKHVYCEKPMTPTIEEADAMIAECEENNVKFMIAFMKRFNRSFRQVKALLDEGRLGQVFEMRARWDNARVGGPQGEQYRLTLASGGGFLQEDGSHPLDVCRWWLGDVSEVSAVVCIIAPEHHPTEDVACVVMKHKSGAISTLHITMLTHATGEESYEVFGTYGTLVMRWPFHSTPTIEPAFIYLYENSKTVIDLTPPGSWNPLRKVQENWQYLLELEHFCECIINDKEPYSTGADGRAVVEIINAAYLSSWTGTKVKLPLTKSPDVKKFFTELRETSSWSLSGKMWGSRY
jgi:predicted dehydrogenase